MHVHGDNLQQKETAEVKYADAESRQFLREIRKQYEVWHPIHLDVVEHLFKTVRTHLTSNWEGGVSYGLERGYLL